ncbi:MAG TPA: hypothetical protein VFT34_06935 [Verrucomicrobiae bacterium]|nr:hypothetical protein [Verrucomicrobiae bacterium]
MKHTETREDEIISEVRRARAEHAAKFNYDTAAIFRDYRRLEKKLKAAGWKVVSLPRRKPARTG